MKKILTVVMASLLLAIFYVNLDAQITVSLKLDESEQAGFGEILFCDKDYNCGLKQNEDSKTDIFGQEKITISIRRTGNDFYFLVGDLAKNNEILLKSYSNIKVRIKRTLKTGETLDLPYELRHSAKERNGQKLDAFTLFQHYQGVGTLKYKNCSSKISLKDVDYDGLFNLSDGNRGTNFSIDFNNDNKFWGKEEHRNTNEIIEICGQNFLATSLDKNILILNPTDLRIARVGQKVPLFSFALLNGQTVSSASLAGKYYVFDFWASWCVPCIANLSQIAAIEKEYKNKLSVFSINVDESEKRDLADKIIKEKQIFDYSTIRGLGDNDPFWKTFGSESTRLFIPLYVLVNDKGTILYSGGGGENLVELKSNITKVISK